MAGEPNPRRYLLQTLLEQASGLTEDDVHFQPPANVELHYPCIIYNRDDSVTEFADNLPYRATTRYKVTVIDYDPDSTLKDAIAGLPLCAYDRFYAADNLNHDVFNLFF